MASSVQVSGSRATKTSESSSRLMEPDLIRTSEGRYEGGDRTLQTGLPARPLLGTRTLAFGAPGLATRLLGAMMIP